MPAKDKHKIKIRVGAQGEITLDWPVRRWRVDRATLLLHLHDRETDDWQGMYLRPKAARKLRDACDRYLQEHPVP